MKRVILALAAMLLLSSPAIYSQTAVKIDKAGNLKKIEKSNDDVANAKKAEKVATWLNRGKVFTDAAIEISKNVYEGMPKLTADIMFGASVAESVVVNNSQYTKYTYPVMVVYMDEKSEIRAWEIGEVIYEGALEEAVAAYDKAYALDADKKNADKINAGYETAFKEYYKMGSNFYAIGQFVQASSAFEKALDLMENHPGYTPSEEAQESELAYNIGLIYYATKDFQGAIEYFSKAEELGYERDGEIYWWLYYSYKNMAAGDVEVLKQAGPMIERGFTKYSDKDNVVECIIDYYIATGKDTNELVATVKEGVENDPTNPVLWNGLARLYDVLEDYDNAIVAFEQVSNLMPDNFSSIYNQGFLYVKKADMIMEAANAAVHTSQASYDAAMAPALDNYRKAIAPLEKAHELAPADKNTVILLQNITNRLRTEPGMQEKQDKYKALLEQMK